MVIMGNISRDRCIDKNVSSGVMTRMRVGDVFRRNEPTSWRDQPHLISLTIKALQRWQRWINDRRRRPQKRSVGSGRIIRSTRVGRGAFYRFKVTTHLSHCRSLSYHPPHGPEFSYPSTLISFNPSSSFCCQVRSYISTSIAGSGSGA